MVVERKEGCWSSIRGGKVNGGVKWNVVRGRIVSEEAWKSG